MQPDEPNWVPFDVVVEVCRDQVALTKEPFQVLNPDLLNSALAKPSNRWSYGERDVVKLAVSLLSGIARNHPFLQGNKRTALIAAVMFLEANGFELDAAVLDGREFGERVERLVTAEMSEEEFTEMLKKHCEPK